MQYKQTSLVYPYFLKLERIFSEYKSSDYPSPNDARLSHLDLLNSTLPLPIGLQLKHVALSVGTQNYSYTSATTEAIPNAIGAIASLLDISPLLISPSGPFL